MKTNFKFKTQLIAFAYVLLAVVFFIRCGNEITAQENNIEQSIDYHGYNLIIIDSCEYFEAGGVPRDWTVLTHKGNCKFCLARSVK